MPDGQRLPLRHETMMRQSERGCDGVYHMHVLCVCVMMNDEATSRSIAMHAALVPHAIGVKLNL
jgi:hypothetical protein